MSERTAQDLLETGRTLVAPALEPHGFTWAPRESGTGSGGSFASGSFVREDRSLELHYRASLGLVTYRLGWFSMTHDDYMRHSGHRASARYPGFPSDPLAAFQDLAYDLAHFAKDFTSGPGDDFKRAFWNAKRHSQIPGIKRHGAT